MLRSFFPKKLDREVVKVIMVMQDKMVLPLCPFPAVPDNPEEIMAQSAAAAQKIEVQREVFSIRDYTYRVRRKSAIDPDKTVVSEMVLICPRCTLEQKCPPYGDASRCPQCGLVHFNHGEELICIVE